MTLALGILCEEGVVLLTDSMALDPIPGQQLVADLQNGFASGVSPSSKRNGKFFNGTTYRAAYAGFVEPDWPFYHVDPHPEHPDWEFTARNFMRSLSRARNNRFTVDFGTGPVSSHGQAIVIAPLTQPDSPRKLGYLDTEGNEQWLAQPGILCAGGPSLWVRKLTTGLPIPPTVDDALRLAHGIATEYVRQVYPRPLEEYVAEGRVPFIAEPFLAHRWRWAA